MTDMQGAPVVMLPDGLDTPGKIAAALADLIERMTPEFGTVLGEEKTKLDGEAVVIVSVNHAVLVKLTITPMRRAVPIAAH